MGVLWCADPGGVSCGGVGTAGAAQLTPVPSSQHRKRRRQGVEATEGDSDRCADLSGVGCSWRRHSRCGHGP